MKSSAPRAARLGSAHCICQKFWSETAWGLPQPGLGTQALVGGAFDRSPWLLALAKPFYFARHGAGAALSAKAVFKPTKEFHTARHTLFTAEQNLEIDKVVPVSASVKTKLGRGGSYED